MRGLLASCVTNRVYSVDYEQTIIGFNNFGICALHLFRMYPVFHATEEFCADGFPDNPDG
jgi:hypothetical protein